MMMASSRLSRPAYICSTQTKTSAIGSHFPPPESGTDDRIAPSAHARGKSMKYAPCHIGSGWRESIASYSTEHPSFKPYAIYDCRTNVETRATFKTQQPAPRQKFDRRRGRARA